MKINLEKMLDIMEEEARRRNAPVFRFRAKDPFQSLVFAILSTRTKDEVTSEKGKKLLSIANSPKKLMSMSVAEIEEIIKGVGFYRTKAKNLKKVAEIVVRSYNSKVPERFEELVKLPGVGRKVANIVLSFYGIPAIAVDTHVHRVANRIGIVKTKSVKDTERELKKIFPQRLWKRLNKVFVGFGQSVCKPVKPECENCRIRAICSYTP